MNLQSKVTRLRLQFLSKAPMDFKSFFTSKNISVLIFVAIGIWWIIKGNLFYLPTQETIDASAIAENKNDLEYDVGNIVIVDNYRNYGKKKMAVVVPYRDCFEELVTFVPYLSAFLNNQKIPFHIYVFNQKNDLRFNRAALINVGFIYIENKFDYMVMHDVDLLPLNPKISYEAPPVNSTRHVVSYYLHPSGPMHPDYYGGILIVPLNVYRIVDGMSTVFWGWGVEDNEFKANLKRNKIRFSRTPRTIGTNRTNSFKNIHSTTRIRDKKRCAKQAPSRTRVENTSLKDTKYRITSVHEMFIDGCSFTMVNVDIVCNMTLTPWCKCEEVDDKIAEKNNLTVAKSGTMP